MGISTDARERDTSLRIELTLNEILARRPAAGAVLTPLGPIPAEGEPEP